MCQVSNEQTEKQGIKKWEDFKAGMGYLKIRDTSKSPSSMVNFTKAILICIFASQFRDMAVGDLRFFSATDNSVATPEFAKY